MINRKIFCKSGPCTKIQLKKIKKDHKNTYVVQKYAKQSENAETNKSKWIILSNCLQDDLKHVLTAEPAAENNTTGADKMDTKRETC